MHLRFRLFAQDAKKPTRVAHKFYEDGSKGRVCAKCGEAL